eukprot:374481-Prorocentrum_minimum.AAC.1
MADHRKTDPNGPLSAMRVQEHAYTRGYLRRPREVTKSGQEVTKSDQDWPRVAKSDRGVSPGAYVTNSRPGAVDSKISRFRNWPVGEVYSYRGTVIGRCMRYIPIEGL